MASIPTARQREQLHQKFDKVLERPPCKLEHFSEAEEQRGADGLRLVSCGRTADRKQPSGIGEQELGGCSVQEGNDAQLSTHGEPRLCCAYGRPNTRASSVLFGKPGFAGPPKLTTNHQPRSTKPPPRRAMPASGRMPHVKSARVAKASIRR